MTIMETNKLMQKKITQPQLVCRQSDYLRRLATKYSAIKINQLKILSNFL